MSHVLVVDDEPAICWGFRELLRDSGHQVTIASCAEEAIAQAGRATLDAIILDIRLPGMDGLSAMEQLRDQSGDAPIIVITAFGSLDTAVKAVEAGAFDYLTKPFDLDAAAAVIQRALAHRRAQNSESSASAESAGTGPVFDDGCDVRLVGSTSVMQAVFKQIALVAASRAPVLITGDSGTGKELVARAIHRHSPRRHEPFLPVSLSAPDAGTLEQELFGYVKGAFPGATAARKGLLELAGAGTILLDEIADVPAAVQARLLRAIEHQDILPIGAAQPGRGQFRVIAATRRNLSELIETGAFREDLYFRLSVVRIDLPPLRDRPEDIPDLARHFLARASAGASVTTFSPAALCELSRRFWPGNVRELRNAVEHAAIMARGATIDAVHLPPVSDPLGAPHDSAASLPHEVARWAGEKLRALDSPDSEASLYDELLKIVEPPLLQAALEHSRDNRAAAARLLGLHRATLRQKLKHHNLTSHDEDPSTVA